MKTIAFIFKSWRLHLGGKEGFDAAFWQQLCPAYMSTNDYSGPWHRF